MTVILTEQQKAALRSIVEAVRADQLGETFTIYGGANGTTLLASDRGFVGEDMLQVSRSMFDTESRASPGSTYTLLGNAYAFVDADARPKPHIAPRVQLRRVLTTRVNAGELRAICFDLNMSYDNLGGETPADRVIALIEQIQHTQRWDALIETILANRPDLAGELPEQP